MGERVSLWRTFSTAQGFASGKGILSCDNTHLSASVPCSFNFMKKNHKRNTKQRCAILRERKKAPDKQVYWDDLDEDKKIDYFKWRKYKMYKIWKNFLSLCERYVFYQKLNDE